MASLAEIGEENEKISQRLITTGTEDYTPQAFPVTLWDVFGEEGIPIRANISDLGPLLFSRLIELNEVQEGLLNIAFDLADKNGLLFINRSRPARWLGAPRTFTTGPLNIKSFGFNL